MVKWVLKISMVKAMRTVATIANQSIPKASLDFLLDYCQNLCH